MRPLLLASALLLVACAAKPTGSVEVANVIAQPMTAAGTSVAIYLSLTAKCSEPDVLEGVSAQGAGQKASLVATSDVDVKLVVKPVASIPIACGQPTVLKPMASHIMVTGLTKPAGIGDLIPLTLRFRNAGAVSVTAGISSLAVLENVDPMNMRKHHDHMPGMAMGGGNPPH